MNRFSKGFRYYFNYRQEDVLTFDDNSQGAASFCFFIMQDDCFSLNYSPVCTCTTSQSSTLAFDMLHASGTVFEQWDEISMGCILSKISRPKIVFIILTTLVMLVILRMLCGVWERVAHIRKHHHWCGRRRETWWKKKERMCVVVWWYV